MSNEIDEEAKIAKEQDSLGTSLSSESFTHPIREIKMPSVIAIDQETTLDKVVKMMQEKKIGSIVLTKDGKLSGILTERDLLNKVLGIDDNWKSKKASVFMTAEPQTLQTGDAIAYALNNMHVGGYRHIPIVDENNKPVSMISIKDVVGWVLDHFTQEVSNLTGEPFRGDVSREGG